VTRRQEDQLDTLAGEKRRASDEDRVGPLAHKSGESCVDLAASVSIKDLDLHFHGTGTRCHVSQGGLGTHYRIAKHGNAGHSGHQFAQEFQPFCHHLIHENIDAGHVAARSGETGDKSQSNRVFTGNEDDRDCRGCCLGSQSDMITGSGDHGDLAVDQIGHQLRHPIELILSPAVDDRHVFALDVAGLLQTLAKSAQTVRLRIR
jgi:hypothetical protein